MAPQLLHSWRREPKSVGCCQIRRIQTQITSQTNGRRQGLPTGLGEWGMATLGLLDKWKASQMAMRKLCLNTNLLPAFIGKREGSRLHSALKSFEFIVRSAVGPLCGLPQPVAVSAACPSCLLPVCLAVRPAFLSFSQFTNLLLTAANCVKLPTIVASFNLCNTVCVWVHCVLHSVRVVCSFIKPLKLATA